jgi:L-lactate dehydrogenase complex protein LldE
MKVGLFIPCYVDQFYPDVGMATVEVLESLGLEVDFPTAQTCCGQPMANTGCNDQTLPLAEKYFQIFKPYDYVVCPSGSCVSMVRNHYEPFIQGRKDFEATCHRTMELCEFLIDVMKVESFAVKFPYRVGLHASCHGLRELRLDKCSERRGEQTSKVRRLLEMVQGIEFVTLQREDECCGFGGTFAVAEEGVSVLMGRDRCQDHVQAGAQVITATDMSCLMHMEGILRREKQNIPVMHVSQILAGRKPSSKL